MLIYLAWFALTVMDQIVYGDALTLFYFSLGLFPLALAVWGQVNLNRYWSSIHSDRLAAAGVGPGEVILSLAGIIFFGLAILGFVFAGTPSVGSVFEAGNIAPLTVGQESSGFIQGFFEVDGFIFQATGGESYVIETGPLIPGDPLEDSLLESNDDFGGSLNSRIEWTAPESGDYYITVENADGISTGGYTLLVRSISR